jgi:hypothetical protein
MQINGVFHEWSHSEKTSGTLNEISIYISQHFEISTEQQLIFFKNSINNSASQALSFLRNAAYLFSETFYLLIIPVFSALILYHRKYLCSVPDFSR